MFNLGTLIGFRVGVHNATSNNYLISHRKHLLKTRSVQVNRSAVVLDTMLQTKTELL